MMKISILALTAAIGFSAPVLGADAPATPNWDATLAVQAANVSASEEILRGMFELVRSGKAATLEAQLDEIIAGRGISQPARDAILFRFASGLADFDQVDPAVFDRLAAARPTVIVPHEEYSGAGFPMFNIAGAAEGARRHHQRMAARSEAGPALDDSAKAWIDALVTADATRRAGFVDALDDASAENLSGIVDEGLARLGANPELTPELNSQLTPAVGKSALLLGDTGALAKVVINGGGSELARILEAAGLTLPAQDTMALLELATKEAPVVNAALAIAQLYTPLAGNPEADDLLISLLDDPDLGSSAALALASSGDAVTRTRLEEVAAQHDGLASSRARLALATRHGQGGLE